MDRGTKINLSNTILYCLNWADTVHFYRHVLELPVSTEKDWFVEFRLTGDAFVSVADTRRATIDSADGRGLTLALQVDDVAPVHARLLRHGVAAESISRHPWGALSFFCRDPEGNRLEFWQAVDD